METTSLKPFSDWNLTLKLPIHQLWQTPDFRKFENHRIDQYAWCSGQAYQLLSSGSLDGSILSRRAIAQLCSGNGGKIVKTADGKHGGVLIAIEIPGSKIDADCVKDELIQCGGLGPNHWQKVERHIVVGFTRESAGTRRYYLTSPEEVS